MVGSARVSGHAETTGSTLVLGASDIATIIRRIGLRSLIERVVNEIRDELLVAPLADRLPVRAGFVTDQRSPALVEWMPYLGEQAVAIKVVAYNPTNLPRYPTVIGTIHLYDRETGRLSAVMDGVCLTAIRTGATSALASSLLARPDSTVMGVVGAGAQSVAHVHAISASFPIEDVLVYDIDPRTAESLRGRVDLPELSIREAALSDVERHADILCTATSVNVGGGPVIDGSAVPDHLHINAVGSDFPGKTEIPKSLLDRATVFPDFRDQAVNEGECQQLDEHAIGPDLAGLVSDPGLYAGLRDQLTVFDSTGMAVQDYVVGQVFAELATAEGLGTRVDIQHFPRDRLNPFDFSTGDVAGLAADLRAPQPAG